jgi:hypothetical protein
VKRTLFTIIHANPNLDRNAPAVEPRMTADPRRALVLCVLVLYCGVSFAVKNLYPFSVFDMYSSHVASASRVLARDAGGRAAEVTRFDGWQCDAPVDVSAARCAALPRFDYTPYKDEELAGWVRQHAAPPTSPPPASAAPVDLIRRIWRLTPDGDRVEDCLLHHCRAARR